MIANAGTDAVGVIAFVGDDDTAFVDSVEQILGTDRIMIVARRDQEADRAAFRIDARVDFRREPASTSAHTTISTFF